MNRHQNLNQSRRQFAKQALAMSGSAGRLVASVGVTSSVLFPHAAHAQAFPQRPISLYCAFPPGGPTDQVMRVIAEAASKLLGQPIVVENKPGAGGTIAAISMKNAKPDGYTLAQMPLGVFRLPHMQKTSQFDPIKDFTYVTCLTGYTFGLVTKPDAPFADIKTLIAWAKSNPEKLTYGHTGIGTSPHLAIEEFAQRAGIKVTGVPFKGSADLMPAVIGGHIMAASDSTGWAPHVEAKTLRLLATYGSKRTKRWPNTPTLTELGYETVSDSPFGVAGPQGMDAVSVKTLNEAFKKALEDTKVLQLMERFDQPAIYMGPEDYTKFAKNTFESERATIDRLGLKGSV
jgi:tripartite-type tricarboxylate transporter receptor subunit TctC